MRTLDSDRLGYWAGVVMLDPRFCGATGTGAYSAVASECVNQAAKQILRERGLLRRMQLVMQYNAERQEQEGVRPLEPRYGLTGKAEILLKETYFFRKKAFNLGHCCRTMWARVGSIVLSNRCHCPCRAEG